MVQRQTKGETTMDKSSIPGLELIQVADVVAREKSIEREEVMLAMEEAIQRPVGRNMDWIVISGR